MEEKRNSMKPMILFYYLIILVVTAFIAKFAQIDDSIDVVITSMLAIYLLLFPLVFRYTYRYALHIFLFTLAFMTGFYGFYHLSVDEHSISNALYFTFRLYLLDFAEVFTVDGRSLTHYPLLLEIARWSAASYTISTVFIAMYRVLEMKIMLFRVQIFGNHHIIFGYNEKSHLLIEDLRKNKEAIIVIDPALRAEAMQKLEDMHVIALQMTTHDETIFTKTAIHKARSVTLFQEEDKANVYTLMELEDYVKGTNRPMAFQKLMIHLDKIRYQKELRSFIKYMGGFSFHVEIFHVYHMLAEKFWQEAGQTFPKDEPLDLLFVGNGDIGSQMKAEAKRVLFQVKVSFTILGDFPTYEKIEGETRIPFDLEKDDLVEVLAGIEHVPFTHIFICLEEDYIDLMEGIDLSEIYPSVPIYMNFTDSMIDHMFTIVTTSSAKTLYSMGTLKDVLTKEALKL